MKKQAHTQGGINPNKLAQEVAQMLQQGAQPQQIAQQLVHAGVPQQQAIQIIQQVTQQLQQSQQGQSQEQPVQVPPAQMQPEQTDPNAPQAYSGIHLNPKNKGKFTATKKATGKTTEELTHSKNPLTRKRAIFAQSAKHFHHKAEDGTEIGSDGLVGSSFADQKYFGTDMPTDQNAFTYAQNPTQGIKPFGQQNMQYPDTSGVANRGPRNPLMAQPIPLSNTALGSTPQPMAPPNKLASQSLIDPPQTTNPNLKNKNAFGSGWKDLAGSGGKTATAVLGAVDALLPADRVTRKYLRPEDLQTTPQHPYGTGSQAIMKKGGKIPKAFAGAYIQAAQMAGDNMVEGMNNLNNGFQSLASFQNRDLDRQNQAAFNGTFQNTNNLQQIAPIQNQFMKGGKIPKYPEGGTVSAPVASGRMDHTVVQTNNVAQNDPNYGMTPAMQYLQNRSKAVPTNSTGSDPVSTPIVDNKGRQAWNTYVQYLQKKGVAGDPSLDSNGLGKKYLNEYMQQNPNSGLTPNNVVPIQQDFQNYRQWAITKGIPQGDVLYDNSNDINYSHFMSKLSKVDGYPGSNTTMHKFPNAYLKTFDLNGNNSVQNQGFATQQTQFKYGGFIPKAQDGLQVEDNMIKPISDQTMMFEGPKHSDGGIQASYGGKPFEAEGSEPVSINNQGSLVVFGNLKNPVTNNLFKNDAKFIANKEVKAQVFKDKGTQLVNDNDPSDKYERLAFNAGKAMMQGGNAKIQQLNQSKEHLGDLQLAAQQLDQEQKDTKAKKGMTIPKYPGGGTVSQTTYPEGDPRNKFEAVRLKTQADVQAKYPGKKVEVVYNDAGGLRTQGQQADIASQKGTISRPFSLHNLDAARDINIKVDGKVLPKTAPEYTSIFKPDAEANGLYAIGAHDPYHMSLIKEGGPNTAQNFFQQYPDARNWDAVKNYNNGLSNSVQQGKIDPYNAKEYSAFTKTPYTGTTQPVQPTGELTNSLPQGQILQGENLLPLDNAINKRISLQQYQVPSVTYDHPQVQGNNDEAQFHNPPPLPHNKAPWDHQYGQYAGELMQLATNSHPDVVKAQLYNPDLYQPYQISMQDSINENNAQFNGIQKQLAYDPTALATLAGQQYEANDRVKAEEFRQNQGINNDIINKNIALLNDAKGKNLSILDQQYVRQEEAKSFTKRDNMAALNSITNKMQQNTADHRQLEVYQNLYPNVNFNKDYTESINGNGMSYVNQYGNPIQQKVPTKTEQTTDGAGEVKSTKTTYEQPTYKSINKPKFKKGGEMKQSTLAKLKNNK